jgi:hypothetical protein
MRFDRIENGSLVSGGQMALKSGLHVTVVDLNKEVPAFNT